MRERKHQPMKFEDTTNNLPKQNIRNTDLGLITIFFDLIDLRKVEPRSYVRGRWVLSIKTDTQGNFLKAKAGWVSRGFQDKQKEYLQTDSFVSTRPGCRMSCQMAAQKGWDLFSH